VSMLFHAHACYIMYCDRTIDAIIHDCVRNLFVGETVCSDFVADVMDSYSKRCGRPAPFFHHSVDGSAVNVSILFDQTLIKTFKRTESVL